LNDALLKGLRVLVMEDEFLIALDVEQICRDHGAADVVIARNLEEVGAEPLGEGSFHVAVLDLMVAGQRTTDFAARLLESSIPFVFATGYTDTEGVLDDFAGVPIVGKPYSGRDLIAALAEAIKRRRVRSGGV
jgi:CheY-like chemotaxis protein